MTEEQTTIATEGAEEQTEALDDSQFTTPLKQEYTKPNLDGEVVTIHAKTGLIQNINEIKTSKDGSRRYKPVILRVYSEEGTYENYGGIRRYEQEDKTFGEPTIWIKGTNNSAKLLRMWCQAVGKNPEEVSIHEFVDGLRGMKARLKHVIVSAFDKEYPKNIIEEFVEDK